MLEPDPLRPGRHAARFRRAHLGLPLLGPLILGALASPVGGAPAWSKTLSSAEEWSGSWHGTYVCAQGVTGVTLAITPKNERKVTAVFSFYPVPQNPLVPSGEFTMTGRLRLRSGRLTLVGGQWTTKPPWYEMVGLDGSYYPNTGEYRGQVEGAGCSSFRLRRDLVG
jgi:hypothetical protein